MRLMSKPERRQAFYGWIRWTPVLALVFAVLFFDAWVNIETRKSDYVFSELSGRVRALEAELQQLRVRSAGRQTIDVLAEAAPALGLAEAKPDQFETIYYDPLRDGAEPLMRPFVMAQLDGKRAVREMTSGLVGFNPLDILPRALLVVDDEAAHAVPMPVGPLLIEAITPPMDLDFDIPTPAPLVPMTPDSSEADELRAHLARS